MYQTALHTRQGWAFFKKCSHSFVAFFKKAIIFPATAGYGYTQPSQVTQNGSYDYATLQPVFLDGYLYCIGAVSH
jgi:hypothetical protein